MKNETDGTTVSDILKNYKTYGVPHFQRGQVWNEDMVALLLESLYHDTPCGSIILWRPAKTLAILKFGVPLLVDHERDLTDLIVDGQQRLRSLYEALGEPAGHDKKQRVWCLNLARVPELSPLLDESLIGFPLFMKVRHPLYQDKITRYTHNLIPVSALQANDIDAFLGEATLKLAKGDSEGKPPPGRDNVQSKIRSLKLCNAIRSMKDRKLFVIHKQQDGSKFDFQSMIELYNRINSGGVRMQAEERAFASMIACRDQQLCPGFGIGIG